MIKKTPFFVSQNIIKRAQEEIPSVDFRITFNNPTGRFFYDPWKLKEEYKGSVWEVILNSLPMPFGEARLIKLDQGQCYRSHADIDDRWSLTIIGQQSFLIDLDNKKMHQTDGIRCWYELDTSLRHSAANFGSIPRFQLVIRKLLTNNNLKLPVSVLIKEKLNDPNQFSRYIFDDYISSWLNKACKKGIVNSVESLNSSIKFNIEKENIEELKNLILITGLILEYGN